MDTTQDSRENGGKRRPQTDGQNRASQRPGQSTPEQRRRRQSKALRSVPAVQRNKAPRSARVVRRSKVPRSALGRAAEQGAQERPRRSVEQNPQERPRRAAEQTAPEQRRRAPEQSAQERPAVRRNRTLRDAPPGRRSLTVRPEGKHSPGREPEKKRPASGRGSPPIPGRSAPRRKPADDDVPNRKRAYGNSKPKKKSALAMLAETLLSAKNRPKKRTPRKSENSRPKTPTPAVIYTQPLPFNRDRLIVQLITVTAVVLAIVMGLSVFFKVKTVTVTRRGYLQRLGGAGGLRHFRGRQAPDLQQNPCRQPDYGKFALRQWVCGLV